MSKPDKDTSSDEDTRDESRPPRPGLLREILGPPIEAALRVWRRITDRRDGVLGRVLDFWRFLFLGPEPDEEGEITPPAKTSLLLASVVLAVLMYAWPLSDILPTWLFVPLAVALVWFMYRAIQYASLHGSGNRWEGWLRSSERRAGLVWWERLGLLLAAGASVLAVVFKPALLPLTLAAALGFLVLLGQPPDAREPRTIRPLPPPLPEDDDALTEEEGYVLRAFTWTMRHAWGADTHAVTVHLRQQTYEDTKASNPGRRWDGDTPLFADYIVDGTTPDIERAANELQGAAREHRYATYEEISLALSFVQSIPYSLDEESTGQSEYWRYPIETLYDETGDCEDTTILAAALLRRLGHSVVTLLLPEHAALGVEAPPGTPGRFVQHQGKSMYYCETTATGWEVGELPGHYDDAEVKVFAVPELPHARR